MGKGASSVSKGKQRAEESSSTTNVEAVKGGSKSSEIKKTTTKKPEKIKLRRLHVSGLPDLTEQEAKDRFKSFGEVVGVDGLGKLDATGKPLRYAFFDIKTTKSKLAQCMNLLSGSMWKGSTLRIAEAKPTFMERLEQERKQAAKQQDASPSKPKKDKKRKRESGDGIEEEGAEAVSSKSRPGWKLDPKTQTPIFPVVMRPDHPLPPPVHVEPPVAGPSDTKKVDKSKKASKKAEKAAKKSKKSEKTEEASLSPPSRARMVKIDPTQWEPKHLRESDLQNLPDTSSVTTKSPKIKSQVAKLPVKKVKEPVKTPVVPAESSSEAEESSDTDDSPGNAQSQAFPSKPAPTVSKAGVLKVSTALETVYDDEASIAERKANLDMVARLLGGIPKDLEPVQETIGTQLDESESEESEEEEDVSSTKVEEVPEEAASSEVESESDSETDSLSQAEETDLPGGDAIASKSTTELSASATLAANASMATDAEEVDSSETVEDEDLSANGNDSQEDDGSSSDGESSGEPSESVHSQVPARLEDVQMQSLTEMFKPQEAAAGFTIGGLLDDFEVDELETLPPISAAPRLAYEPAQAQWSAPAYAPPPKRQEASTSTLFFPFPLEEDEAPGGILHDMDPQDRERLLSRSWTGTSNVRRFKRTQTMDEITSNYESVRRNISEQVRKRHREAVKRQKRHGGKRALQGAYEEA